MRSAGDILVRGTQGYAEQADELVARYEAISFIDKHSAILPLLPKAPAWVLDIGAGTGADAAWLAQAGYRVVAVEPTDELRARGMALHPSPSIEWLSDSLPKLELLAERKQKFNLIMLTAVWMHLDAEERRYAMPTIASLLEPHGLLVMTIRHGPVPQGRLMFEVSASETLELARTCGLRTVLNVHTASVQAANQEAGITWSRLVFDRA